MTTAPMGQEELATGRELLFKVYKAFNRRDVESILVVMHPDVEWPNGMEGGWVHGREGVRAYWTRQWSLVDPHVEPVAFKTDEDGRIVVDVHQVVRDLKGAVLLDRTVQHAYLITDGLIRSMEIRE
jgi:nuclear transport factor 2 (NTF2) superfamily protein